MITISPATPTDFPAIWPIFQHVIQAGDSYVFSPDMSFEDAQAYWMNSKHHIYVAKENNTILGSYILKANQPDLGAHVANASFIVSSDARGKGIGRKMGNHCIAEAKRLGFRAIQFNIVVSTNTVAVKLWESLGFAIIGTAPKTYKHKTLGYVDTYIMFLDIVS